MVTPSIGALEAPTRREPELEFPRDDIPARRCVLAETRFLLPEDPVVATMRDATLPEAVAEGEAARPINALVVEEKAVELVHEQGEVLATTGDEP
jgi:hypothetical protein